MIIGSRLRVISGSLKISASFDWSFAIEKITKLKKMACHQNNF